jgi:peptidoglycan/xylan/chitin deacetylase (PgdA/CDA1 family)
LNLLIVNFHYFNETQFESGIYPVSKKKFIHQINELGKDYDFISQFDLADCFSKKEFPNGNYCLLTFDDGLKEQMDAFVILQELKIPAVYYIPVKPLVDMSVLDVHKLQLIRSKVTDEQLLTELKKNSNYLYTPEDIQKATNQYKYDGELARELKFQLNFNLSNFQKAKFLSNLFKQIFGSEQTFSASFYMNKNDLQTLATFKQIGAHGYEHTPLALMDHAKLDLKTSMDYLFDITHQPIRSISYPFGSKEAVNDVVANHAKNLGVDFALTMWRGINTLSEKTNPFLLNRIDTNDVNNFKNKT